MPRIRVNGTARAEPGTGDAEARRAEELRDTAEWLHAYVESGWDDLHPDQVGISRREPKSLLSPVNGRIGSIPKPKSPAGKPEVPNPYSYSRHGRMGRWQQRG